MNLCVQKIVFLLMIVVSLSACSFPERKRSVANPKILLDRKYLLPEIKLEKKEDHRFVLSNKIAGFFVGHTHAYNENNFEGWVVNEHHLLRDYKLYWNGQELNRQRIKAFILHPYGFERIYQQKVTESFALLDSVNVILLKIKTEKRGSLILELPEYKIRLTSQKPEVAIVNEQTSQQQLKISYYHVSDGLHYYFFRFTQSFKYDTLNEHLIKRFEKAVQRKKNRLRNLLQQSPFFTPNTSIMKAIQWAMLSLDGLVTQQRGPGIWAGLPWFNNYWGRDTFISFNGALLINGQFATAKRILKNFARFQLKDEKRRELGRIPNRITNKEVIYNTADGTWWFIRSIYEYFLFTGDEQFLKEMYPVIKRAINGAIVKRVDKWGFLTHGEAETWMDAVGSNGPWTPRGNRAVEIQALWYTALQIGVKCAQNVAQGDKADISKWTQLLKRLRTNFNQFFWNSKTGSLYDHINKDGSKDSRVRPNQIFAVTVPDLPDLSPLLDIQRRKAVARFVTEYLTTENGVLSLWYQDEYFHPYHHYQPYYVPDAAYHNGLIWGWLAGPVMSAFLQFNQQSCGQNLFLNEVKQILHFDALGSYSELLEPVLRKGESQLRISGTISQAWSLAEFLRNVYHDLVGYQPMAYANKVFFKPHLIGLKEIRCRLPFKKSHLDAHLIKTETGMRIRLFSNVPKTAINGVVQFPDDTTKIHFILPDSGSNFEYEFISTDTTSDSLKMAQLWHFAEIDSGLKFATIDKIPFKLLKGKQIYFPIGHNGPTVVYGKDALNDDNGINGRYTYPLNKNFVAGIADIKNLTIYDNDSTWGFRIDLKNLVDPGWHPEYGFQLTFLAIAIQDPLLKETQGRQVGHKANVRLPAYRAYNRIIYVGGGIEICNGQNQRKALYVPLDKKFRLGFVSSKQIRFQVPKSLIPGLNSQCKITVLCGLQDDHGGSGLGDFRQVLPTADQWHGGGALTGKAPAVYDVLEVN